MTTPEADYYRLRTEWLRFKSQLFDGLTGLPALPAVMEDVRRIVESRGAAEVVYLDLGRSGGQEMKLGWAAYDEAVAEVFATLDWLEQRLGRQRYLAGDRLTEADWRCATTLFRFDLVYHGHFKCNRRRLVDYPRLWAYARELYQVPGVSGTVNFAQIAQHYYTSHQRLNPGRIVPVGPDMDWNAPHGRG